MVKVIRISDETYRELVKLKGQMTTQTGQIATIEDVVKRLIKIAKEKVGKASET